MFVKMRMPWSQEGRGGENSYDSELRGVFAMCACPPTA